MLAAEVLRMQERLFYKWAALNGAEALFQLSSWGQGMLFAMDRESIWWSFGSTTLMVYINVFSISLGTLKCTF